MVKVLATVGLSLILASTAATASPNAKPESKPASEQQYCLTFDSDTGSHISRTECRTKKEWRKLGVDVDEMSAREGRSAGQA